MKKILVLSGFIGSGKDTAASFLIDDKTIKLSFASILKDVVSIVFSWNRQLLEGDTRESREWREKIDDWWSKRLKIPELSPRWVLQQWGTNVLRNHFHPDIWIAAVEKRIYNSTAERIVITDCRFPNEIKFLESLRRKDLFQVHFIWIRRPPIPLWVESYFKGNIAPFGIHPSEYQWLNMKFDMIIDNDDTLESLKNKILAIL